MRAVDHVDVPFPINPHGRVQMIRLRALSRALGYLLRGRPPVMRVIVAPNPRPAPLVQVNQVGSICRLVEDSSTARPIALGVAVAREGPPECAVRGFARRRGRAACAARRRQSLRAREQAEKNARRG